MPLIFADLATFATQGIQALGYVANAAPNAPKTLPLFEPGPVTAARLLKLSPQAMVFFSLSGGGGLTTEDLFDEIMISARVIGRQGSYDDAEQLMLDIDFVLCQAVGNTRVGKTNTLGITRAGGRPSLADYDKADRYHFQGSYITEAASDLVR